MQTPKRPFTPSALPVGQAAPALPPAIVAAIDADPERVRQQILAERDRRAQAAPTSPWRGMGDAPRDRSVFLWQADGGLCRARWSDQFEGFLPEWGDNMTARAIDPQGDACYVIITDAAAWAELLPGPVEPSPAEDRRTARILENDE